MKNIIKVVLFGLITSVAWAGGIKVEPTRITLTPQQPIATLSVGNPNQNPILIQTEIYRRAEHDGQETLTPTEAIVILPMAFHLPPGQKQQIRVVLQRPVTNETTYRLFLSEIPLEDSVTTGAGLNIALRIGIPIDLHFDPHEKTSR